MAFRELDGESPAIFGGNWNNGSNCGSGYVNLNNAASNSNSNIGGSPLIIIYKLFW